MPSDISSFCRGEAPRRGPVRRSPVRRQEKRAEPGKRSGASTGGSGTETMSSVKVSSRFLSLGHLSTPCGTVPVCSQADMPAHVRAHVTLLLRYTDWT
ncbi:hypothetical protein VZT92_006838 [Zoarces viviparus]|uniref:Uncharacterized protein n=1 Tax=Zoarces viviparus TaxID=48416 RepID=A0AAW1FND4_ZOAVI